MIPIHISYSVAKNCYNHNSFGEICIQCNCCGRFEKGFAKYKARLVYHKENLNYQLNFDGYSNNPKVKTLQMQIRKCNINNQIIAIRNYTRLLKRLTKIKKR